MSTPAFIDLTLLFGHKEGCHSLACGNLATAVSRGVPWAIYLGCHPN